MNWTEGTRASESGSLRILASATYLAVCLLAGLCARASSADLSLRDATSAAEVVRHELTIELDPGQHQLVAQDQMTVQILSTVDQLAFTLHPSLEIKSILQLGSPQSDPLAFTTRLEHDEGAQAVQLVTVRLPHRLNPKDQVSLVWRYHGAINDPPRNPRHLRFVTPSETHGHIGSEGTYLSGETNWYPDLPKSLARFKVRVTIPEGWKSVTHGRRVQSGMRPGPARVAPAGPVVIDEWEVADRTEALTLVANRFVEVVKPWGDVQVMTYLFPEDASLADEYLSAAVEYLQTYSNLLGRYPFPKFAVVENFFASGLGMPSFTLLGSGVIKRHYVQPYALGHEIVHSWVGNWVLNDPKSGNWVEGLTTYLANYYFDELKGRLEDARQQRRMMLMGYAVYVTPEEDYPVARFRQKVDQKDNAIGYQKTAMVFHMLRGEIGEEPFWRAIRLLISEQGGRYTTWADLERIFSASAGLDLRWFFDQWVERPGAPTITVELVQARPLSGDAHHVQGRVVQRGTAYRLRVPVLLTFEAGQAQRSEVHIDSAAQEFSLSVGGVPRRFHLDPDFEIFRRWDRTELPPMLNLYVTDRERSVILPRAGPPADVAPYEELATRLGSQGTEGREPPVIVRDSDPETLQGSMLVLGGPEINPAAEWVRTVCGDRLGLSSGGFRVEGQTYHGPDFALLISCRHPRRPADVVTLFYGTTPEAAAKVARLLFFYGWQSYLVFRNGSVVARGDFSPFSDGQEVRLRGK
jgi:aminopeptidase N